MSSIYKTNNKGPSIDHWGNNIGDERTSELQAFLILFRIMDLKIKSLKFAMLLVLKQNKLIVKIVIELGTSKITLKKSYQDLLIEKLLKIPSTKGSNQKTLTKNHF